MASFPTSVKSFTTRNAGDTIQGAHVNDLQDEVNAIESTFVNGQARCQVYNSNTQSINDNSFTAITFDSEDHDTGAMHSTATNTSRLTVPANAGGAYLVCGGTRFAANGTGTRVVRIVKNGATQVSTGTAVPGNASVDVVIATSCLVVLAAGDYVELQAYQNSGGALAVGSGTSRYEQSFAYAVRVW